MFNFFKRAGKPKYEYNYFTLRSNTNLEEHLNGLGADGWYVVTVDTANLMNITILLCRQV